MGLSGYSMLFFMGFCFGLNCASMGAALQKSKGLGVKDVKAPARSRADDGCTKAWLAFAADAVQSGDIQFAVQLYTDILNHESKESSAYLTAMNQLAHLFIKTGEPASAINCLSNVLPLTHGPEWHKLLLLKGYAHEQLQDIPRSVSYYKRGHKAHPGALYPAMQLLYLARIYKADQGLSPVLLLDRETLYSCAERLLRLGYEQRDQLYWFQREFPGRLSGAISQAEELLKMSEGSMDILLFPEPSYYMGSVSDAVFNQQADKDIVN